MMRKKRCYIVVGLKRRQVIMRKDINFIVRVTLRLMRSFLLISLAQSLVFGGICIRDIRNDKILLRFGKKIPWLDV